MLINISHCLFPDCHHYPTSETFRPGAQAMLCWFAWLGLWMGKYIINSKGILFKKEQAHRENPSHLILGGNVRAVKWSFTESKSEMFKNLLSIPQEASWALKYFMCLPVELTVWAFGLLRRDRRVLGKCFYHFLFLHFTFKLSEILGVYFGDSVNVYKSQEEL